MSYRLGIDIGGTFTDLILLDDETGHVKREKVPTTPIDLSLGALEGTQQIIELVDPSNISHVAHGTTAAINAIVERKGVPTALITTKGFSDITEIGREKRSTLYDLSPTKPPTFTNRYHRFEIDERITSDGKILRPLPLDNVDEIACQLKNDEIESVAISLLNAYCNDQHERNIRRELNQKSDLSVSISSEILREIGEYERTLATVIDAYISPIVSSYLSRFAEGIEDLGISETPALMQANGGVMPITESSDRHLRLINSGPAAGVLGGKYLAEQAGIRDLITLDIGGTTTDTGLISDGQIERRTASVIELPGDDGLQSVELPIPQIDVRSIGAGGGSIAWVDRTGGLKVGPKSSGAKPGPASYGRGGDAPTVTDAVVVLGYLGSDSLLGGTMQLDVAAANSVISELASHLDLEVWQVAEGILRIVTTNMMQAIRLVTIEKGHDPRNFALMSYGGAGPLFGTRLAAELDIEKVIVPPTSGILSAYGLVVADTRFDFSAARYVELSPANVETIVEIFNELSERSSDATNDRDTIVRTVDARYKGQLSKVTVELPEGPIDHDSIERTRDRFSRQYANLYGHSHPSDPIEGVSWRLESIKQIDAPPIPYDHSEGSPDDARRSTRDVLVNGRSVPHPVFVRELLPVDNPTSGPAIIEEPESTTIVQENQTFFVDETGLLHIDLTQS